MPKKIKSLNDIPSIDAYLKRIGAEPRSLRTAVVREMHGSYWKDIETISFNRDGSISWKSDSNAPTPEEVAAIAADMEKFTWPELKLLKRPNYPKVIKDHPAENIFEFRNEKGELIMLQVRHEPNQKSDKRYVPWTYWDDNEWRPMEPEGKLPLWGLEQLKDHAVVFIHEGAKAAKACYEMVNGTTPEAKERLARHPWAEELGGAAHIGWIGGALSPLRTDWSAIKKAGIQRAFIVSDNDPQGISAVPEIAKQLRIQTFQVQFTNEWPLRFDLADDFPEKMFKKIDGRRYYAGPAMRACIHPATWATDVIEVPSKSGKGRPAKVVKLRDNFKEMWAYIEEADLYVCTEMPEILRNEVVVNKMLAAFSDTHLTSQLIVKAYTGRSAKICYRPDVKGRTVTNRGTSAINLHTPTQVKSQEGNPKPFLDFMDYLIPDKGECEQVLRWCATLIAHPEVRMEYGLLLVSAKQGIGKTTLGQAILAPLVGHQNVSYPSENDIVNSDFNGWLVQKRLIVVNEIYSGHSWKAYNKLKSFITDMEVNSNEKFQRTFTIDNWAHIFAASNSTHALKIEDDDRRWYVPTVNETRWPKDKFTEFYGWINSGGLGIIKHWAENFSNIVVKGERAPGSVLKQEIIEDSQSDSVREIKDLARELEAYREPVAFTLGAAKMWLNSGSNRYRESYERDAELKRIFKEAGCRVTHTRVRIAGRLQFVVYNSKLAEKFEAGTHIADLAVAFREFIKSPNDILGAMM